MYLLKLSVLKKVRSRCWDSHPLHHGGHFEVLKQVEQPHNTFEQNSNGSALTSDCNLAWHRKRRSPSREKGPLCIPLCLDTRLLLIISPHLFAAAVPFLFCMILRQEYHTKKRRFHSFQVFRGNCSFVKQNKTESEHTQTSKPRATASINKLFYLSFDSQADKH